MITAAIAATVALVSPPTLPPATTPRLDEAGHQGARPGEDDAFVEAVVSPQGRAFRCLVVSGKAVPQMDAEICIEVQKAQFKPALDAEGHAAYGKTTIHLGPEKTSGDLQRRVFADVDLSIQALPKNSPLHPTIDLGLAVDQKGAVLSCGVLGSSGVEVLDAAACKAALPAAHITPVLDEAGAAVVSVQRISVGFGVYPELILKKNESYPALGVAGPYYPERAERLNVTGYAVVDCAADASGLLSDCQRVEESPIGYAFVYAVTRMAKDKWVKIAPGAPRRVLIRIDFTIAR